MRHQLEADNSSHDQANAGEPYYVSGTLDA